MFGGLNLITFQDLQIEVEYRSDKHDVYKDFYEKCLERSISYDRAVGYFTSNSLKLISRGLEKFIKNNGKIRIITSPNLTEKDIEAIGIGEELRLIEDKLINEWKEFVKETEVNTLKIFSWLIAKKKLEIKVAYQKDFKGLYHEKFGIFTDEEKNMISFSGSVNETVGGMKNNFESIDVFSTLNGDSEKARIFKKKENFKYLWENNTNKINVITIPEALERDIISFLPMEYEVEELLKNSQEDEFLRKPVWLDVREYQKDALNSWIANKCKGILEMATGTGKTITALNIMTEFYNKAYSQNKSVFYVILCPQKFLVKQWREEVESFGAEAIICDSDSGNWQSNLRKEIEYYKYGVKKSFIVITTNATFLGEKFQKLLKPIVDKNMMLIVDECHNIGSFSYKKLLGEEWMNSVKYRLGLSATPERSMDIEGNDTIEKFLGKVIYEYTMEEAISNGFLTKYNYYVHFTRLDVNEEIEYLDLTEKITKMQNVESKLDNDGRSILEQLRFKRARIIHHSLDKRRKLLEVLEKEESIKKTLIYVGAGKHQSEDESSIDVIINEVKEKFDNSIKKFTSNENKFERNKIINEFNHGYLDIITAIKCLDEGVNIPSIEKAFILASTTNPREYIQRRGRVLRLYPGKEKAHIHDFIIVPRNYIDDMGSYGVRGYEKNLLKKELIRVREFALLADNYVDILGKVRDLQETYSLNVL
jgi:superfamily II DNA or RNA helicase